MRTGHFGPIALLALVGTVGSAAPEATEEARRQFGEEAAAYRIVLAGDRDPLQLHETPVLHWGNPGRTGENGAFYLWLRNGRPEVAGSVFTYQTDMVYMKHELVSLAAGPLRAEYRGQLAWEPDEAGVVMRPLQDAPVPAAGDRQRLAQMRAVARRFSATLTDENDDATELRLMTQPLHRYDSTEGGIADGALFAFASSTDPEVLLLIESRAGESGPRWHYGLARCHYVTLRVRLDGEEVWSAEPMIDLTTAKLGQPRFQSATYTSFHPQP